MDFKEANLYKEKNISVIGQYLFPNKPHKIEILFIAPKSVSSEERLQVLKLIYSGNDNIAALTKLNWLYENLDVYFLATDG